MGLSLPANPTHDELFTPLPTQEDPGTVLSREIADFLCILQCPLVNEIFFFFLASRQWDGDYYVERRGEGVGAGRSL